jgi:1,4-alpha-glucan branching enzyme
VLVPIDRAVLELVWSEGAYPASGAYRDTRRFTEHRHQAWSVAGGPYRPAQAAEQVQADAEDFVARAAARVRDGGLCVVAFDTELLGLHWHEGVDWLRAVLAAADAAGLRIAPLDELLDGVEPRPAPSLPVTSWGTPRTLATWSAPGAGGLAWRQRAAELRAAAAAPAVPDRALRELLALQSSDWAFLGTYGTAGPYPAERAAAHERAFDAALTASGGHEPALRNLAPHLVPGAFAAP